MEDRPINERPAARPAEPAPLSENGPAQPATPPTRKGSGCGALVLLGLVLIAAIVVVGVISSVRSGSSTPSEAGTIPYAPACADAMAAAELEPAESDRAILSTLDTCVTADLWIVALQAHPLAGTLTSYTRDDAVAFLDLACMRRVDAVVCVDAAAQGLLSYELDDPRLVELQVPRT